MVLTGRYGDEELVVGDLLEHGLGDHLSVREGIRRRKSIVYNVTVVIAPIRAPRA